MLKSLKKNFQTSVYKTVTDALIPVGTLLAVDTNGKVIRKANTAADTPFSDTTYNNIIGISLSCKDTNSANENVVVCTGGFIGTLYNGALDSSDILDTGVTFNEGDALYWAIGNDATPITGNVGDGFWTNVDTKADYLISPLSYGVVTKVSTVDGVTYVSVKLF